MQVILFLTLLLVFKNAHAEESLCSEHEKIVFSCHTDDKMVSLCRLPGASPKLVYRFGTPDQLVLVHSGCKTNGKSGFYTLSAPLFGGGETLVTFQREDYEYKLYSKIGRSDDEFLGNRIPIFEDGLIISRKGKQIEHRICDDGGEGFREDISWLPEQNHQ